MKFIIDKEKLYKPLQLISGAVSSHPNLAILSNILLEVRQGVLHLTATDTEIELRANVVLDSEYEEGAITVPARKFLDICRSLSDTSSINFSLEDTQVLMQVGRSRYTLSSLPATDFPNVDEWESLVQFDVKQEVLQRLIESCQFSMAQQDVRYYLNGMYFETEGNVLRTVSTDGHRLSKSTFVQGESFADHNIIVPRKGVIELSRLLVNPDENVSILIGKSNIRVLVGDYNFTSKLVDGNYPDYKMVIPQHATNELIANREELKVALSRAGILSNEKFRGVRFNFENNLLKLTANNPQQEKAEEVLDVQYSGTPLEIGFNVNYVIDVMNNIKSEFVRLSFTDANTSVLIEATEKPEADPVSNVYIVMPIRL